MATGKNHQAKKEQDFKKRKSKFGEKVGGTTDHEAIRKAKIQEKMMTAMPVEDYEPLFKKVHELAPLDGRY